MARSIEPVTEHESVSRPLRDGDIDELREQENITVEDDGEQPVIKTEQYIGVVGLDESGLVEVEPKASCDFLYVLAYTNQLNPELVYDTETGYQEGPSFIDILARLFVSELDHILERGLDKTYQHQRDTHRQVRGSIDVNHHIRRGNHPPTQFVCEYRDRVAGTTANQALLTAAKKLQKSVADETLAQKLGDRYTEFRKQIPERRVSAWELTEIELSRLNYYYQDALTVAKLVLSDRGIEPLRHPGSTYQSVLININTHFERLVQTAISRAVTDPTLEVVTEPSRTLIEGRNHGYTQGLKPDFIVQDKTDDTDIRLVGDAKWKIENNTPKGDDFYQMVAYQQRSDAPCLMAYPPQDNLSEDTYDYNESGIQFPQICVSQVQMDNYDSYDAFESAVDNWAESQLNDLLL